MFNVTDGEHQFSLSVCDTTIPCDGATSSGCITNPAIGNENSMGSYTEGNLGWDDTGLSLVLSGGAQCSRGPVRSTKVCV